LLSLFGFKDKLFYGWVVAIAFFAIQVVLLGTAASFGVFFKSIESEFNLTRATTSAILSVSMLLLAVFSILGGWALDRYGPKIVLFFMGLFTGLSLLLTSQTSAAWQLFITYSLLLAMGSGATYVVTMSTVSRWFDKKRGLAVGIAGSGGGLGVVAMAPFATYLISRFDWQIAYLVIGLIAWLTVIPLSRLLRKDPYEIGALPDGVKPESVDKKAPELDIKEESLEPSGLSILETFKTREFWLVIFIWLLFSFCMLLVFTHIVPHTTDIGISAAKAAAILSLMGGARAVGMVLLGNVADKVGRKRIAIICTLFQAGAMVWLVWAQGLWMLCLFAIVYGLANGGLLSSITAILGDTFGLSRIGAILGVLDVGWAIGAATGPVIGGFIFDISANYSLAFLLGAVAMAIIALLIALIRREAGRNF
jgi:OFA family oxalate/formate antiporter-like MFS transporter